MKQARWLLAGAMAGALGLCACGPDVALECQAGQPVLDGQPFSCAQCFAALGCEGPADGSIDCPSGITGSCQSDLVAHEYCCEGDCITCP